MSSAIYYRLFWRRMSEYLYSRLSVIGWYQTIIQNMDTFLSEWLRRKHFWKMFWSYIVQILPWILLWQDLKEQFGLGRPNKNSSARQLDLQFLGSSVFRIEKANVVMKTSSCLCLRSARHIPAVLQSPHAPSESPGPAARSAWTPQFPPPWGDVIWTRFTQPSCREPCFTVPQEVRLETTMSLFCIFFPLQIYYRHNKFD